MFLFFVTSFTSREIPKTVKIPANIDGILRVMEFNGKKFSKGTKEYIYPGSLWSPKASKSNGKLLPHSSLPVFKIEKALYPILISSWVNLGGENERRKVLKKIAKNIIINTLKISDLNNLNINGLIFLNIARSNYSSKKDGIP